MLNRSAALITGVSRKFGVGPAFALKLAESGWGAAVTFFRAYSASQP